MTGRGLPFGGYSPATYRRSLGATRDGPGFSRGRADLPAGVFDARRGGELRCSEAALLGRGGRGVRLLGPPPPHRRRLPRARAVRGPQLPSHLPRGRARPPSRRPPPQPLGRLEALGGGAARGMGSRAARRAPAPRRSAAGRGHRDAEDQRGGGSLRTRAARARGPPARAAALPGRMGDGDRGAHGARDGGRRARARLPPGETPKRPPALPPGGHGRPLGGGRPHPQAALPERAHRRPHRPVARAPGEAALPANRPAPPRAPGRPQPPRIRRGGGRGADRALRRRGRMRSVVIRDCVLLRTEHGPLVAYVVPAPGASLAETEASLRARLPADRQPSAVVPLASLPLLPSGEVDEQALLALPVVDADLVARWEDRLRSRPEIDRVAVVVQEGADPEPRVPLRDLVPRGSDVAAKPVEPPRGGTNGRETVPAPTRPGAPALVDGGPARVRPGDPETLPEALARAARSFPGPAVVHYRPRAQDDTQTFAELLREAERVLAGLRSHGLVPGGNVLLVLGESRDILPAFWGCVLGGFVPVVVAPPATGDAQRAVQQLRGVFDQLGGPLVVAGDEARGPDTWRTALGSARVAAASTLRERAPDPRHYAPAPDDVAFYSLTSGSTGVPKCVMLTHRNVLRRARGMDELCGTAPDDVVLNWLPFDHIGSLSDWHLRCVALGCRSVYVAKEAILERPLFWLDLLDRYRATHSWAPTFAYRLLNDALARDPRAPWDLSRVKGLLSAGEQVSLEVERELLGRLGRCGLRKEALWSAFGMAETASGITYERPTPDAPRAHHAIDRASLDGALVLVGPEHPNRVVFSSLGRPIPGTSIRIVGEDDAVLPELIVGRLHVKGDAVSRGFYGKPDATREVFREDGWFDTGDRGFVADGHLVLTGRGKDVIVVNGANYASAEIESVVEEVPGTLVSFTVACAVRRPGSDREELAVLFPTLLRPETGLAKLLRAVQARVVQRLGVKPSYLVPLDRSHIAKTAIGKLRRQDLKARLEAGEFDRVLREVDVLLGREATLPEWFHREIWRRSEPRSWSVRPPPPAVLVFVDRTGLGESVRREIEASGSACVAVESGTTFTRLGARRYRIAPARRDHYQRLLEAAGEEAGRVEEVLHFWNFGEAAEVASREELERAQDAGVFSLLFLAQTLSEVRGRPPRVLLRVVSSRTEAVRPDDLVACERTPVLGLLGSLALEMPWLDTRHLDLPADSPESNARRVMTERAVDTSEERVAYREGRRHVVRLERTELSREPARVAAFEVDRTYLVCGGPDGAGPAIVEYLLTRYRARVLFAAGTPPPDR